LGVAYEKFQERIFALMYISKILAGMRIRLITFQAIDVDSWMDCKRLLEYRDFVLSRREFVHSKLSAPDSQETTLNVFLYLAKGARLEQTLSERRQH
jgi:hypothetical protein